MNRDTLLLVTTSYPQAGDGSEAAGGFVADLARELAKQLPVRVVAPGRLAGITHAIDNVSVSRFASPGRPLSLLSPLRPGDWLPIITTLRSLREQTLQAGADGRVAHVLALWILPSGWAAAALQRAHGTPYSVWALGSDIWTLGRMPVLRALLRLVVKGATHRYADGLQLSKDATSIAGLPFEFLPSTRNLAGGRTRPLAAAPPYRLLFLGRWHPNKGIDLLLEALALLGEDAWARIAEIRIAGGGPLDALVRGHVAGLQARGRPVRLDGFLDRTQAADAIANADWLLIPSRIESIPVVFSDAMKLVCPVITTPVGDLPELVAVDPACGVIATSATPAALEVAISAALLESPRSFEKGVERAAKAFDIAMVVDRIVAATRSHTTGSRQWT